MSACVKEPPRLKLWRPFSQFTVSSTSSVVALRELGVGVFDVFMVFDAVGAFGASINALAMSQPPPALVGRPRLHPTCRSRAP